VVDAVAGVDNTLIQNDGTVRVPLGIAQCCAMAQVTCSTFDIDQAAGRVERRPLHILVYKSRLAHEIVQEGCMLNDAAGAGAIPA
jgi:hypothetical protein